MGTCFLSACHLRGATRVYVYLNQLTNLDVVLPCNSRLRWPNADWLSPCLCALLITASGINAMSSALPWLFFGLFRVWQSLFLLSELLLLCLLVGAEPHVELVAFPPVPQLPQPEGPAPPNA